MPNYTELPTIHLYNSLTKSKEVLRPITQGHVKLYVCGMTVYDHCHIGHGRVLLVFDVFVRFLQHCGYTVTYIRNITDVDDKIIQRADANKEPMQALTERFIDLMQKDCQILNIEAPDQEPKATEFIPDMTALIQRLLDKGAAYLGSNGDVYFDVHRYEAYGALSHRKLSDLQAGARVEVDQAKRSPLDFVLWKSAKPSEAISWESPWGPGRPGWHIECSAMSLKCLGDTFDVHGGGHDLKFPHHENERAQSEAATGKPFVNIWMHAGFVQIDQEKMSKSLGNFLTIQDCLKEYHPEVLRYFMLASHYRSPVDYSDEAMGHALKAMERMYRALEIDPKSEVFQACPEAWRHYVKLMSQMAVSDQALAGVLQALETSYGELVDAEEKLKPNPRHSIEKFKAALCDDLNTPVALAALFELVKEINRFKNLEVELNASQDQAPLLRIYGILVCAGWLRRAGQVLGLLGCDVQAFLADKRNMALNVPNGAGVEGKRAIEVAPLSPEEIEDLQRKREGARLRKDFAEADRIRDMLQSHGVALGGDKRI